MRNFSKLAKIFQSYFNEFGGLKTLKYAKHVKSDVKYVEILGRELVCVSI